MSVSSDNPIQAPDQDALTRDPVARAFAHQLRDLDRSQGVVVGVLGPWGSGKTSFVNLTREHLRASGCEVLDFNPWMFSGAEQLVESFFIELASQMRLRPGLAAVGQDMEDYGEVFSGLAWVPLVGPWIDRVRLANKILGKLLQRRKEGSQGRRQKLMDALRELDKPIVVVIDDIDRLTTAEIRDVFKLVRLTASFPNIIYLLAFDRMRVETALGEDNLPGRQYLEKILQLAQDLPMVPERVLLKEIATGIDAAIESIEKPGPFDEERWPDVFIEVVRPLIGNMRDIRRYALAVRGTVQQLEGQIALVDVIALEAVRVFLPDVFERLHFAVDGLTEPSTIGSGSRGDSSALKTSIEQLTTVAGDHAKVIDSLIRRVFPAGSRHLPSGTHYGPDHQSSWMRNRRVAHPELLRLYLERQAGESLAAYAETERIWPVLADRDELDRYLRSLDQDQVESVISSLEAYEDQYQPEHVVPATIVLLNLLPDLPKRPRGMFMIETSMVVGRVTYRLLRSLKHPERVEEAVAQILPELTTLSSKLELITDIGYTEGAGHKLVTEAAAAELEHQLLEEVRSASAERLSKEPDLLRVLYQALPPDGSDEDSLVVPDDPAVTLALLKSARTETLSQTMGDRAVRRSPRLVWDSIANVVAGEDHLKRRIKALLNSDIEMEPELRELVEKYMSGWRPKNRMVED